MKKEVVLSYFPQMTYRRYTQLSASFFTLESTFLATHNQLRAIGWNASTIEAWFQWKPTVSLSHISQELALYGITPIALGDDQYPVLLSTITDPPICLFVRGNTFFSTKTVGVVGTRKNTSYGKQVTEQLVGDIATRGVHVISGLALGIDAIAHNACLRSGGITVAVLAGGIDAHTVAPRAHYQLSEEIITKGGSIVSEYPPLVQPTIYSFPKRNRIIAGLSRGTVVIEAPKKSGSLITADCALQYNREVMVVPQNITSPTAQGTNDLLKQGAHPITSYTDILEILQLQDLEDSATTPKKYPSSQHERDLLSLLSTEPTHIDELIRMSTLSNTVIMSTLMLMEMNGFVKHIGGMKYVIRY